MCSISYRRPQRLLLRARRNPLQGAQARVVNGAVISATGVSGVRYKPPDRALDRAQRRGRNSQARSPALERDACGAARTGPLARFSDDHPRSAAQRPIQIASVSPAAPRNCATKASIFCATIRRAASQATSGTSFRRIRRTAARISRPIRLICASSHSGNLSRRRDRSRSVLRHRNDFARRAQLSRRSFGRS
jgi:hypothetical protein